MIYTARCAVMICQACGLDKKIPKANAFGIFWRRHPDLNWGIKVLQTSALPLGYGAIIQFIKASVVEAFIKIGAGYEARTRYLHLGKVALYQMS